MVRVWWQTKTGATGHGAPMLPWEAIQWLNYLRRDYPDMEHWLESAQGSDV